MLINYYRFLIIRGVSDIGNIMYVRGDDERHKRKKTANIFPSSSSSSASIGVNSGQEFFYNNVL